MPNVSSGVPILSPWPKPSPTLSPIYQFNFPNNLPQPLTASYM